MTAWLITGGAGFIGSNFARMASERDVETIVVLDALTYAGNLTNIADLIDMPFAPSNSASASFRRNNIRSLPAVV